jgi:CubicO group peptidase (beta-lactamase class C family)
MLGQSLKRFYHSQGLYDILHEGTIVHTENFGRRDYDKKLAVDEDTNFWLCSLAKTMVAAGVGMLVDVSRMSWDARVKDTVPGFRTQSDELHRSASLLDYLSMGTSMQQHATWLQSQNNVKFLQVRA